MLSRATDSTYLFLPAAGFSDLYSPLAEDDELAHLGGSKPGQAGASLLGAQAPRSVLESLIESGTRDSERPASAAGQLADEARVIALAQLDSAQRAHYREALQALGARGELRSPEWARAVASHRQAVVSAQIARCDLELLEAEARATSASAAGDSTGSKRAGHDVLHYAEMRDELKGEATHWARLLDTSDLYRLTDAVMSRITPAEARHEISLLAQAEARAKAAADQVAALQIPTQLADIVSPVATSGLTVTDRAQAIGLAADLLDESLFFDPSTIAALAEIGAADYVRAARHLDSLITSLRQGKNVPAGLPEERARELGKVLHSTAKGLGRREHNFFEKLVATSAHLASPGVPYERHLVATTRLVAEAERRQPYSTRALSIVLARARGIDPAAVDLGAFLSIVVVNAARIVLEQQSLDAIYAATSTGRPSEQAPYEPPRPARAPRRTPVSSGSPPALQQNTVPRHIRP